MAMDASKRLFSEKFSVLRWNGDKEFLERRLRLWNSSSGVWAAGEIGGYNLDSGCHLILYDNEADDPGWGPVRLEYMTVEWDEGNTAVQGGSEDEAMQRVKDHLVVLVWSAQNHVIPEETPMLTCAMSAEIGDGNAQVRAASSLALGHRMN